MGIFSFFRTVAPRRSADQAKERLQVLLALERKADSDLSFLPKLQEDILKVISQYLQVDDDKVTIEVERGTDVSMLDINIELPDEAERKITKEKRLEAVAT